MFFHFSLGTYELAFLFVIDQPAEINIIKVKCLCNIATSDLIMVNALLNSEIRGDSKKLRLSYLTNTQKFVVRYRPPKWSLDVLFLCQ